jgi:hypothetical protein
MRATASGGLFGTARGARRGLKQNFRGPLEGAEGDQASARCDVLRILVWLLFGSVFPPTLYLEFTPAPQGVPEDLCIFMTAGPYPDTLSPRAAPQADFLSSRGTRDLTGISECLQGQKNNHPITTREM